MRKSLSALILGVVIIALDQLSKIWVLNSLEPGYHPILGKYLGLQLAFNSGAAFSLGSASTWIFTVFASVCAIGLPFLMFRVCRSAALGLGLIWGGAIGNLIDRLFREPGFPQGHVVDFISYNGWFIGNVADIALVVGCVWVILASCEKPKSETS